MATFIFTSSGSIGMSTKTFAQAKAQVARVMGAQAEPDALGAGDAIHLAIDRLNEFEWNYLTVEGSDLTFTDSKATLPTPFKKPLSLIYNNRALPYVHQGDWDNSYRATGSFSTPTAWTFFAAQQTGSVRILPSISDSETAAIKYYRPIAKPSSNNELLDIPTTLERALILDAQAQMLIESGLDESRVRMLVSRAEMALYSSLGNDRSGGPDADQGFTPAIGWSGNAYSWDHAQTYIREAFGE